MNDFNPYPVQVADLITDAFKSLGEGLAKDPGSVERRNLMDDAGARFQAAQAVATLAHAHETRTLALVQLAALDPIKVQQGGQVSQEAYTAAAIALNLVEDEDAPAADDALIDQMIADGLLESGDPADKDLGDLA